MLVNPQVDIAMITLGMTIVYQLVQRKVMNRKAMNERQKAMKENSKRMKELMQKTDAKSVNELKSLEKESMDALSKMSSGMMKMMGITFVVYLPVLWYIEGTYPGAIEMPFSIPWFGSGGIAFTSTTNYIGWYVVCGIIFSIIFSAALSIAEKVKKQGKMQGAQRNDNRG